MSTDVESTRIMGIRVENVTTDETLQIMARYVAERRFHQVVTLNPEFVMLAQKDPDFRAALDDADLALPDGAGLLWASRILGQPLRERVTGSDTTPLIAQMSAEKGYRLFFLGAAPGVAERAAAVLRARYPGVQIVGVYPGSPDPAEADEIIARITAASPDFLLVAFGAPKQDVWIHRHRNQLAVPVCMGIGGTFDFIAGVTPRAPRWMCDHGLEWLYRLWRQPWRWRRMLALPRFAWRVIRQKLAQRSGS